MQPSTQEYMTDDTHHQQTDMRKVVPVSVGESGSMLDDVILARTIELRRYGDFRLLVEQALGSSSWSDLVDQIRRIADQSEAVVGWELPLREGVVRDALIDVLDLHKSNGIDRNLLDVFKSLDADNLGDLREQALRTGIAIAKEQIRRGNTFFFDIEALADNSYAVLVPDILERRRKEVEWIDSDSSFGEIYSTYYGFTVLTSGGFKKDSGGASHESVHELESILGTVVTGRRQIRYSSDLFGRVTPYTRKLLWNLLRISLGGRHSQTEAAKELGEMGDSRAVDLLHHRLVETKDNYISKALIGAIGSIGCPESFELLCSKVTMKSFNHVGLDVIPWIGGVRHPEVYDFLMKASRVLTWYSYTYVIHGMARSRDMRYVPVLIDMLDKPNARADHLTFETIKAIKQIGDIDAVNKYANRALNSGEYMSKVIGILNSVPDIEWRNEMIKAVVKGLVGDYKKAVAKAVREVPELLENPAIKQMLQ